ncbi:MAG TPA: putative sulfate exporter family transporter, partial [Oceanospirillaceae bacterium]|nr:putative sulfate exporter family transporter [Oceanospirillaceae bacterium]
SAGFIAFEVSEFMVEMSRWCLILAMVGLGMKSSFKELAAMGWRPIALMLAETLFLAGLVLIWLQF